MGLFEKAAVASASGCVTVASAPPGAIKQALNQSGWLDEEVIAAGQLRQGKAPSMVGMLTGTALVELGRPRQSKSLPRHFVLAATADRVVAFKATSLVMGEDDELLRIKPDKCGSWPRASVRMIDLPDGALSKGGTLELEGRERLPVSRPNLDGDPNTDELLELLGGLSIGSPARSLERQRYQQDQHDLRRASDVRAGDAQQLAAEDARRGRPDVDLGRWAQERGLSFQGPALPQGGHLSVTCPWSEDLLFNVVRGRWPGGTDGVLCHEVRLFDIDTAGFFHGGEVIGPRESVAGFLAEAIVPLPLGGERSFFKVPYTCAGARVPHLATLTGLHVARVRRAPHRRRPADRLMARAHAGGPRPPRAVGGPHPQVLRRAHRRRAARRPGPRPAVDPASARLRDPDRVRPGDRVEAGLPEARRGSRRARGDGGGARRRRP